MFHGWRGDTLVLGHLDNPDIRQEFSTTVVISVHKVVGRVDGV